VSAPWPDLDEILTDLRASGERITTARRAVLQVLLDHPDEHLTMDEVAALVHASAPEVHLSTVYRTVEFLEQAGVLVNVHLQGSPASYHFTGDAHHHARCDECGTTIALPATSFDALVRRLARDHGFEAHPHHLVIPGRCAACARASGTRHL
jgi:Fur family ferric uptake transcriptional regulator